MIKIIHALAFGMAAATGLAAPVSITPASLVYTQNFDALGTAAAAWADDATIPGWQAQINNGGTVAGNMQPADGTTVLSGLLNLGAAGAGDRALGSRATGTNNLANIAYGVSFRNDGPRAVAVTQLRYAAELWRTNSGTGTPAVPVNEEYTVFYRISSAPVTNILSGATSVTAAPGTGFTAWGAAADWSSPVTTPLGSPLDGNDGANRSVITAPFAGVIVPPGQYLTLKWTDANENGPDGFQGIDDVRVEFTELEGSVSATVFAGVRDSQGTPSSPADDLFGFSFVVSGSGGNRPWTGWTTSDVTPPNTAASAYGTTVTWTGFPVTGEKSATFTDNSSPLYFTSIAVSPPRLIGLNQTAAGGIVHTSLTSPGPWLINESLRTMTLSNGGGVPAVADSAAVDLAAVSGVVEFSARLTARDTSSGFETDDIFLANLILNDGTETIIPLAAAYDTDGSGAMNGAELAPGGGTLAVPTVREYTLSHLIPDNVQSARLVIQGANDSTNETLVVDNILFRVAPAAIQAVRGAVTINNQNTDAPGDDTFSTPVTITAGNNSTSTGWTSNNPPPASGSYAAAQPVIFGPYPVSGGVRNVTLTDEVHPVSTSFTLAPPVPALTVTAPANIVRRENGPGLADDTVTFEVTITGSNGGPRWVAGGAASGTGAFGTVTLTISAGASPAQVTISDISYPAATQSFSVSIPVRYTLGWFYNGATLTDVCSDTGNPPAAEWVNDPVLRTLDMTAGGTSDKVVPSDVLDLAATGTVWFSAVLRARDTSTGTNFESTDRFKAELILNAGTPAEQTVNLIAPWDTGDGAPAVGTGGGPNGPPNGWLNGYTGIAVAPATALDDYNANRARDEFNRTGREGGDSVDHNILLSHTIPAEANTAQLRIFGTGIASSEFFTVSRIIFSTVSPAHDSDGDGVPDLTEFADGTDPHNAVSVLTFTGIATGPGGEQVASFPTIQGRLYRGYLSTNLATWTRDDSVPAITGDGASKSWTLPVLPPPGTRHYLKILSGFTQADFPATLP